MFGQYPHHISSNFIDFYRSFITKHQINSLTTIINVIMINEIAGDGDDDNDEGNRYHSFKGTAHGSYK